MQKPPTLLKYYEEASEHVMTRRKARARPGMSSKPNSGNAHAEFKNLKMMRRTLMNNIF
jgi:hypothetical protein